MTTRNTLTVLSLLLIAAVLGACSQAVRLTASLTAMPATITAGQQSVLSWTVQRNGVPLPVGEYRAVIMPGDTDVSAQSSVSVSPTATTEYTLRVTYGSQTTSDTATVTVTPVPDPDPDPVPDPDPDNNDAPAFTSTPVTAATVGSAYSYTATATDPEGDDLTFSAANLPAWLSFNAETATLSGTPTSAGAYPVTITVSDGELSATQTFTITVTATPGPDPDPDPDPVPDPDPDNNDAPVFTSTPVTNAVVGYAYSYSVSAGDPESDPITLTTSELPGWLSFSDNGNGTGLLSGTPTTAGPQEVTITASDGELQTTQTFTITVAANVAPVVTITSPESNATLTAGETVTLSATVTDEASGLEDSLVWTSDLDGALDASGPVRLSAGTHTLTASVTDAAGAAGQATVTVTVNAVFVGFDEEFDAASSSTETVSRGTSGTSTVRRMMGTRITLGDSYSMDRLGVIFSAITGNNDGRTAALALYAHNETTGGPGEKIAESGSRTINQSGPRLITAEADLEPGTYWIVLRVSVTSANRSLSVRYITDPDHQRFSIPVTSDAFPQTFPAVTPVDGAYNVFARLN